MHINGNHAQRYADELSWRDDFRRSSNGQQFKTLFGRAIKLRPDAEMVGYWQKRPEWVLQMKRRQKRQRELQELTRRRRGHSTATISYPAHATE